VIYLLSSHIVLLLRNTLLHLWLLHFSLNHLLFLNILIKELILLHIIWGTSSKVHRFILIWIFSWVCTWILIHRTRNILLNVLKHLIRASSISWSLSSFTNSLLHFLRIFLIATVKFSSRNALSWLICFFDNISILNLLNLIGDSNIIVLFFLQRLL